MTIQIPDKDKIQTIDLHDLFTKDELSQVNELFLEAFTRKFKFTPEFHELITQIEYSGALDDDEDGEPSDQEMMAAFGTKWHDGL